VDAWSIQVLMKELGSLYEAFCEGAKRSAALPMSRSNTRTTQYRQRRRSRARICAVVWSIGNTRFRGPIGVGTCRATDRGLRPKTSPGDCVPIVLGHALSERVVELSQRSGVTVFMTTALGLGTLAVRGLTVHSKS